ncbi:MAG TPA: F0F1 ATP synthase subunit delta [Acidimicrobiales bacterium]
MNPTLQGYAAAVIDSAGSGALAEVAADLGSVEQLVLGNGSLRSALTDTSVRGPDRRAVMLDLLEGKISEPARRVAAFAAGVVGATDVPAALGWVATRTRHVAEGQADEEPSLSLLASRQRVSGYATAVHEDLSTQELESVEDDLFRFARIVANTPQLRSALVDRDLDVEARQGLVAQLLEGKVQPATLALARYAVVGGRARDIVGTLDYLVEETAKARGWRIARVRSAAPIEEAQRSSLSASLGELAGAPVELQVEIDESLLSGVLIEIGDVQVDATARGRIDALREHLVPAGWEDSGFHRSGIRSAASSTQTEGAG